MNQIELELLDNTKILIESFESFETDDLFNKASGENICKKPQQFLNDSLEKIKLFSNEISKSIKNIDIKPDETEIEFSVKFSSEAGIIISSISTEANLKVKLIWKNKGNKNV